MYLSLFKRFRSSFSTFSSRLFAALLEGLAGTDGR